MKEIDMDSELFKKVEKMLLSGDKELRQLGTHLFLKLGTCPEDIQRMRQFINSLKRHLVEQQDYTRAAELRDLERELIPDKLPYSERVNKKTIDGWIARKNRDDAGEQG